MSDANIRVSVDTSEIDVALAKLDAALERANGVTGDVTAKTGGKDQSDWAAFWNRIEKDSVKANKAADVALQKTTEIKGLEQSAKRIVNMLPGLREAYQLQRSIKWLSTGNIVGIFGLVMMALNIYRAVSAMFEEQKKQQEEYQRAVMQLRELNATQYQRYEESQRMALESWKTKTIR